MNKTFEFWVLGLALTGFVILAATTFALAGPATQVENVYFDGTLITTPPASGLTIRLASGSGTIEVVDDLRALENLYVQGKVGIGTDTQGGGSKWLGMRWFEGPSNSKRGSR